MPLNTQVTFASAKCTFVYLQLSSKIARPSPGGSGCTGFRTGPEMTGFLEQINSQLEDDCYEWAGWE